MERDRSDYWQQLLHRWFVQYNPIYLVSAMLVIGGMIVSSRGLAHEGSLYGPLGVALIAEVYACSLIGAAALLTRIGQRRPAVLLALITVVYQSDLTLHTETCAFLGGVGVIAGIAWLAFFIGKLYALAWALRIRLGRRAVATAIFGAMGLTVGPHVIGRLDATASGAALALFVFVLGSLYPRGDYEAATSRLPIDDWGRTVLRRSVRATWILWAVLLGLHVLFWSSQRSIQIPIVIPAIVLLVVQRSRSESRVWTAVIGLLAAVFVVAPAALSVCALLSALALAHRAFAHVPSVVAAADDGRDVSPYRAAEQEPAPSRTTTTFAPVDAAARGRLLSGALFGVYLSAWTMGWSGGTFPAHILALDASLVIAVVFMAWRMRARMALGPLAVTCLHGAIVSGLVPRPHSLLEWGGAAVALGFLLLIASVATSYRLRHVKPYP